MILGTVNKTRFRFTAESEPKANKSVTACKTWHLQTKNWQEIILNKHHQMAPLLHLARLLSCNRQKYKIPPPPQKKKNHKITQKTKQTKTTFKAFPDARNVGSSWAIRSHNCSRPPQKKNGIAWSNKILSNQLLLFYSCHDDFSLLGFCLSRGPTFSFWIWRQKWKIYTIAVRLVRVLC